MRFDPLLQLVVDRSQSEIVLEGLERRLAKACAKDVKSVCGDVKPSGGKLAACMKEHFSDLSTDCQIAYVKVAAVGRACRADMKKFCADVKPGQNAKAACLKSHAADLSEGCKDAMAKVGAGGK